MHLQSNLTSEETPKEKKALEAYSQKQVVIIRHYHADNGRFTNKYFIDSVNTQGEKISYYGVKAQFQNGIEEKRIRDLQEQ